MAGNPPLYFTLSFNGNCRLVFWARAVDIVAYKHVELAKLPQGDARLSREPCLPSLTFPAIVVQTKRHETFSFFSMRRVEYKTLGMGNQE